SDGGSFAQRTVRRVLPNGIILDIVENHANPTVAIRGLVLAGDATAPTGKFALPDLTVRMLQRGTTDKTKEQIGALLDGVGATRRYSSNLFEVNLVANGLSRDLPVLLDIISSELRQPAF